MGGILLLIVVFILVLMLAASSIKIVPQAYAYVVERLGAYQATKIIIPSEIQGLAGLVSSIKEVVSDPKK